MNVKSSISLIIVKSFTLLRLRVFCKGKMQKSQNPPTQGYSSLHPGHTFRLIIALCFYYVLVFLISNSTSIANTFIFLLSDLLRIKATKEVQDGKKKTGTLNPVA